MASITPAQTILQQIESQFFVDYALFAGALRNYTARTLEESFNEAKSDKHRRFFLLGLLKKEYSAYEDVGAFLSAFLAWRAGSPLLLETLLAYPSGSAYIDKILTDRGIVTDNDLYTAIGLDRLIPADRVTVFPGIDLDKCLHKGCEFLAVDCRRNQNRFGMKAFNKIKHGGMVVPDASKYIPDLPSAPAALFEDPDKTSSRPYRLHTVEMYDWDLDHRLRSIEFIQDNLRLLSALYVTAQYPTALRTLGIDPPHELFQHPDFADVLEFLAQVTTKSP